VSVAHEYVEPSWPPTVPSRSAPSQARPAERHAEQRAVSVAALADGADAVMGLVELLLDGGQRAVLGLLERHGDGVGFALVAQITDAAQIASVCRSRIRFRLRDLLVLVDETVHQLPASYPYRAQIRARRRKRIPVGWALPAPLMRPMSVVVRQVLPEHGEQVAGVVDQDPFEALAADRANPALDQRVDFGAPAAGVRRTHPRTFHAREQPRSNSDPQ